MKYSRVIAASALAFAALAVSASSSRADVKYTIENAVFDDTTNTHLTGWFTINTYGYIETWDLTSLEGVTQGSPLSNGGVVTAFNYTPSDSTLGPQTPFDSFVFERPNTFGALQLVFKNPLGLVNDPILGGAPGPSWENLSYAPPPDGGAPIRYLNTDAFVVATVPEPSTWAMMLIGFASLGFANYRRARNRRLEFGTAR